MSLKNKALQEKIKTKDENINQGDCVQLKDDNQLFQVIGIDNNHNKCWIRRWPLLTNGSPVFEVPTNQIVTTIA